MQLEMYSQLKKQKRVTEEQGIATGEAAPPLGEQFLMEFYWSDSLISRKIWFTILIIG